MFNLLGLRDDDGASRNKPKPTLLHALKNGEPFRYANDPDRARLWNPKWQFGAATGSVDVAYIDQVIKLVQDQEQVSYRLTRECDVKDSPYSVAHTDLWYSLP